MQSDCFVQLEQILKIKLLLFAVLFNRPNYYIIAYFLVIKPSTISCSALGLHEVNKTSIEIINLTIILFLIAKF